MPYIQRIENCFAEALGGHGLTRAHYDALLTATAPALQKLRAQHDDGSLPLLRLPAARDDLAALTGIVADHRRRFGEVVVLGTGGSSLGGQTLCALADAGFGPRPGAPRLRFVDNVDPHTIDLLTERLDLARTGFIVISKSGSTAETLTQFFACFAAVRKRVGADVAEHFLAITEPADNGLRRLAGRHGIALLDHDPKVGGRYSALSLVGLLPAMIAGLDAAAVRDGAAAVLAPVLAGAKPQDVAPAIGAALSVGLDRHAGASGSVLMPYIDRLAYFGLWYRQLWAESLGKQGKGTTPINALGTVDQHSQLQLYLDGPRDKMFTVVMLDCAGAGARVDPALAEEASLAYIAGRTVGDLMDAEQRATAATLVRNGRPTRVLHLARLDERAMGALMMHYMLETIIAAHLLGVDPFDQPSVEEGKVLTRKYLAESAGASS